MRINRPPVHEVTKHSELATENIDYTTLEDGTVTIRDRDSMEQVRVHKDQLIGSLVKLMKGAVQFNSLV